MRHARVTRFKLRALNQVTLDDAGINVAEKAAETLGHVSNGEAFNSVLFTSDVHRDTACHRQPSSAGCTVYCRM